MPPPLPRDEYTVGWVCALPIELAVAQEMLDEEHGPAERFDDDENIYHLGSIAGHNVVIVCLPAGYVGNNPAAAVATQTRAAFKGIRFGLMVGIGGGVPTAEADIRLGDVVVSQPSKTFGGVVQYDSGKSTTSGFERTGLLRPPPQILLNAVASVQASELRGRSRISEHITKLERVPKLQRVKAGPDFLFKTTYHHQGGSNCDGCDRLERVPREIRESEEEQVIHYGTIASGNRVIKSAVERDKISAALGGILCFEMEAAGLMDYFPCLVIRGICDYADSHKNKKWQPYAAAMAAAWAKEVLLAIPTTDIKSSRTADEIIQETAEGELAVEKRIEQLEVSAAITSQLNANLLTAAADGKIATVKQLLDKGADIHTSDDQLRTALHFACHNSQHTVALYLLKKHADVNEPDAQMMQPLHIAASQGDTRMTSILLQNAANPNASDVNRCTPLHLASHAGHEDTVISLLRHGADWSKENHKNQLPSKVAICARKFTVTRKLRTHAGKSGKLHAPSPSSLRGAITRRDLAAVEELLARGTYVTTQELYMSILEKHFPIFEVVIGLLDDESISEDTWGILSSAATHSAAMVKILLRRGANANTPGLFASSRIREYPLRVAIEYNQLEVAKLLVEHDVDLTFPSIDGKLGDSALIVASLKGYGKEFIGLFIRAGADIDDGVFHPTSSGRNPLQTAVYWSMVENVQVLLEYGASPTEQGWKGSALEIATKKDYLHVFSREKHTRILGMLEDAARAEHQGEESR